MTEYSTNFLDKALELLYENKYQLEPALQQLHQLQWWKDFKEPELSKEELKKFKDRIQRYSSELGRVFRHIRKSQKHDEVVCFDYMWKKKCWQAIEYGIIMRAERAKNQTKLLTQGSLMTSPTMLMTWHLTTRRLWPVK